MEYIKKKYNIYIYILYILTNKKKTLFLDTHQDQHKSHNVKKRKNQCNLLSQNERTFGCLNNREMRWKKNKINKIKRQFSYTSIRKKIRLKNSRGNREMKKEKNKDIDEWEVHLLPAVQRAGICQSNRQLLGCPFEELLHQPHCTGSMTRLPSAAHPFSFPDHPPPIHTHDHHFLHPKGKPVVLLPEQKQTEKQMGFSCV
jgi:hypothetical protein